MSIAISVVIPLFNKEKYIARAIDSVLCQTFQNFEIIVVDDGSIDDSPNIVEKIIDIRIRLIKKENGGVSSARNRGIKEARADLIAFLDADDAYKPDFLERVMYMHREYPEAGAYATNYEIVDEDNNVRDGVKAPKENFTVLDISRFFEIAIFGRPVFSSAVAVRKAVFESVGVFPLGVKMGEDLDTWIRIVFEYPIVFDSKVGASYFKNAMARACVANPPVCKPIFFDTLDQLTNHKALSRNTLNDINEFKNLFIQIYAVWQIKHASAREGRRAFLNMNTRIFIFNRLKWITLSFVPRVLLYKIKSSKDHIASLISVLGKGWK